MPFRRVFGRERELSSDYSGKDGTIIGAVFDWGKGSGGDDFGGGSS